MKAAIAVLVIVAAGVGAFLVTRSPTHDLETAPAPRPPLRPVSKPPGGATLAFTGADGSGDIVRVIAPSGHRRTIVRDAAHPAWSPDGKKLAFEREDRAVKGGAYEPSPDDIWVVNADGTGLRRLTHNPAEDHEPAWSPDGKRMLFVSRRNGDPEVYVMNTDGSGQRRVIERPNWADRDAAWSPDGRTIVFSSTWGAYDETEDDRQVVSMQADGTRPRRLTSGKWLDMEPAYSPDGTKIVFERRWQRSSISPWEIWVMAADGSNQRRLTRGHLDEEPTWSSNGRWVAFERTGMDDLHAPEIWSVRLDGSGLRRLTDASFGSAVDPAWRPRPRQAP